MRLADLLRPDLVMTGLAADGRDDALRIIAERLAGIDEFRGIAGLDARAVLEGLIAREESHTTCLGGGIALPHATLEGLAAPLMTVATAPEPIAFDGRPDGEAVRLFFVLLSPPGHEGDHIRVLARICRIGRDPELVEELLAAATPEALAEVVLRLDREQG